MKLSAYIITVDAGFAPNPFGRYCTLACCKPTIRRKAEVGDIIVGTASARLPKPGHLVYAMKVKCVLPYLKYWRSPKFASRKPTQKTAISRRGDNIWRCEKDKWKVVADAYHDESQRDRDIGGENVLIATEFFYFGCAAVSVPAQFQSILETTQGHKNTFDGKLINRFWKWVEGKAKTMGRAKTTGRIADPFEFTDAACGVQYGEIEEDDVEEC